MQGVLAAIVPDSNPSSYANRYSDDEGRKYP